MLLNPVVADELALAVSHLERIQDLIVSDFYSPPIERDVLIAVGLALFHLRATSG